MMHVALLGHQPKRRPNCLQSKILAKDNIVSFSTPIFVDIFWVSKIPYSWSDDQTQIQQE